MEEADRARTPLLQQYSSVRRYFLENKRFHATAEIVVRMTYEYPGHKSFAVISEHGSGAVRKHVLRGIMDAELEAASEPARSATRISPRNYSFRLVESAFDQGRLCYVLEIAPKTPNRFLIRGRIWVDAEDLAIARIDGSPAQNPSFWVRRTAFVHTYQKLGRFWLPALNHSQTEARVFGHTEVRIEYSDYRIQESAPAAGNTASAAPDGARPGAPRQDPLVESEYGEPRRER